MTHKLAGILILLLLLTSCAEEKDKKDLPLRFEKESIVKKTGQNCDTAEYDCTIISLEVVKAKGAEVSGKINKSLEKHVIQLISPEEEPEATSLEQLSENFISDFKDAAESFSEEPPWEAYLNESVYLKSEDVISIGITTEIFSGGAHGYKTLTFLNFDPETGKIYSAEDLFTPEFSRFVEEKFRNKFDIPSEENINSTGFWFENDIFHLPENIGFEEDKLILVYNSYEIASYAAGDIYMEIPMEEVKPFLKIE
ncbi:MAG: DUF3298 domain-containing protein [Salinimicrobium sp.]